MSFTSSHRHLHWAATAALTCGCAAGASSAHAASVHAPWNQWQLVASPAALAVIVFIVALAIAAIGLSLWQMRSARNLRARAERRAVRLRLALYGSGAEFWDWDIHNDTLRRIGADQLVGGESEYSMTLDDWRTTALHPDDLPHVQQLADEILAGNTELYDSVHRIRNTRGEWIWVHARGRVSERAADGTPLRLSGTAQNVTASRAAASHQRIASEVIRSMSEAVTVTDLDYHFVSVNPAFTRMMGYSEAQVLGQDARLLDCERHSAQTYQQVRRSAHEDGHWNGELWQRRRDGSEVLCRMELNEVLDASGQRGHFVAVMTDITDSKRNERELRYLASFDALTGLPNRSLFGERLREAVNHARRDHHKVAVLFLDLDRFKQVNDALGHTTGDRMLRAAGARLRESVRSIDTVARLGGDEFVVIVPDLRQDDEAGALANVIIDAFGAPLKVSHSQEIPISPSIGVALYPDHGETAVDLLKCADTAMYRAKELGRNTWTTYSEAMDANVRYQATALTALRSALENHELRLVFQPKMALTDSRVTGVEALLRWHHPSLGNVPPAFFIPLAEEAGLIGDIGQFVLGRACETVAQWQRNGMVEMTVAVNVSSAQLIGHDLFDQLQAALARNGMSPASLQLELTETLVMADPEASLATLNRIRALGASVAVDDFGTGYSSLAYLKRLPIDTLKIDKSFVDGLPADVEDEAITNSIINMAHTLGLNVVAEGVETMEQLRYLRDKGCDEIQGNVLSEPLAADACVTFLLHHDPARFGSHPPAAASPAPGTAVPTSGL